jgi:hypothetical protein
MLFAVLARFESSRRESDQVHSDCTIMALPRVPNSLPLSHDYINSHTYIGLDEMKTFDARRMSTRYFLTCT